jgi:hypothetical protein
LFACFLSLIEDSDARAATKKRGGELFAELSQAAGNDDHFVFDIE